MVILGVVFGLGTAVSQSFSYLFSRHLVTLGGWSMARLLVISHVVMGAAAGAALPFIWSADLPPIVSVLPAVGGVGGFYVLGQLALFTALRHTEASRVAPLLGLKLLVLAGLSTLVLDQALNGLQWLAVVMSVGAAFVLNYTGGRNPWPAVIAILIACCGYAGSDTSIRILVEQLGREQGPALAGLRGMLLTYALLGAIALPLLRWYGSRSLADWRRVLPYSAAWFAAMVGMFGAVALVNVVLASILQSTRALISVVLGALLAKAGYEALEAATTRGVFIRRLIAAGLMVAAIALYVSQK